MLSLQQSQYPLAFKVSHAGGPGWVNPPATGIHVRVLARSLEGMQKEAFVLYGPTGTVWRMASDEGPYLNGTDLAPFPLAFFTSGLAASYFSSLLETGRRAGVDFSAVQVVVDSRYTMSGSALAGTMKGEALPVEIRVNGYRDGDGFFREAANACAGFGLLRTARPSEFTLRVNGSAVAPGRLRPVSGIPAPQPDGFDQARPQTGPGVLEDIIEKLESAPTVSGEGGAGSSLASTQKRVLHLRGIASLRSDGIKQVDIQLFRPIGSSFRLLSDSSRAFGGRERAPSGLAYIAAGIAFCYMTQLGRYAAIVRKPLQDYRLVQDLTFRDEDAGPVQTHVSVKTSPGEAYARTLIEMGAQTCFLHAACQSSVRVEMPPAS